MVITVDDVSAVVEVKSEVVTNVDCASVDFVGISKVDNAVGDTETEEVCVKVVETVDVDFSVTMEVGSSENVYVGSSETVDVDSSVNVIVGSSENVDVGSSETVNVDPSETVDMDTSVTGDVDSSVAVDVDNTSVVVMKSVIDDVVNVAVIGDGVSAVPIDVDDTSRVFVNSVIVEMGNVSVVRDVGAVLVRGGDSSVTVDVGCVVLGGIVCPPDEGLRASVVVNVDTSVVIDVVEESVDVNISKLCDVDSSVTLGVGVSALVREVVVSIVTGTSDNSIVIDTVRISSVVLLSVAVDVGASLTVCDSLVGVRVSMTVDADISFVTNVTNTGVVDAAVASVVIGTTDASVVMRDDVDSSPSSAVVGGKSV